MSSNTTLPDQISGTESQLLRTLIDNLPDYIYVKDTESRFLVTNLACALQLGASHPDQVLGKTDADFVAPELAAVYRADEQAVMRSGIPVTKEEPTQHKQSGEMRWSITTKIALKDESGEVVGLMGIGRDITKLKLAEDSLRHTQDELEQGVAARTAELSARNAELAQSNQALTTTHRLVEAMLDNIPDRIYFKDAQSRFLKLSKALAKRLGVENPNLAIGKTDFDYIAPEKAREFYQDEQRIIRTGQSLINKVEKQILPNGETAWTSTTKVPLRDPDGKVVGLVGINRDITDLKSAELKVEAIHKELLEVSRQAGMAEVATGVLHNVGNVLNSVNVAANVIAERLKHSKSTGVTKLAKLLVDHSGDIGRFMSEDERGRQIPVYLKQLAEHLEEERSSVRDELGKLTLNIDHIKEIVATQQNYARVWGVTETVALSELMEDAIKIHGGAYERHGIKLIREYDPVPSITVDKHKVMQIIVNFLSNAKYACDATNKREKKVIVRIIAGAQGHVKLEVTDNGMGIAKENLIRIFSQGFTTRKGGHGFGLHHGALAARELGGSVNVLSEGIGHGATFVLELPTVPPPTTQPKP